jgi:hypothetical protein
MDPAERFDCQKLLSLPYFKDFRKTARARSVMQMPPVSLGAKYVAPHVILQIELNVYSYFVLAIVTKIEVHR